MRAIPGKVRARRMRAIPGSVRARRRKGPSTQDACDPRKSRSTQDACDPRKDPAAWLAIARSEHSPRYKKLHKKLFLWDQCRTDTSASASEPHNTTGFWNPGSSARVLAVILQFALAQGRTEQI